MKGINFFNKKKDMSQNKEQDLPQNEDQDQTENIEGLSDNIEEHTTNNDPENDPTDELSKLEDELAQTKDKYVRLVAEFDNFRKRTARERNELIKSASEDVIASLLDVLDDAERAELQMEKSMDLEALKSGVNLIFNKLRNALKTRGLIQMESVHTDFDPELHEAITEIPAPSEDQIGKVIDEVQKGYYLNDKIIRHAKVVVGK